MAGEGDVRTLVVRMRAGDPDAINEFVTRYRARLVSRVRLALLTKWSNGSFNSHAETVVDDALFRFYVRIMRGPLKVEEEDRNLIAYILGISRNLCVNMSRSNRRRRASEAEWHGGRDATDGLERRLDDVLDGRAILESMRAGALSCDDAELLIAYDIEGKTYVEIARQHLGIVSNGPIDDDLDEKVEMEANRLRMRAKKARARLASKFKSCRGDSL